MPAAQGLDLRHHRLDLAGLDVGDVHVDAALKLRQLLAEGGRAQMAQILASARSSSLNAVSITRCATFMSVQPLPQRRVGAGVAGEDPGAAVTGLGQHRETDRRHGVHGGSTSMRWSPMVSTSPIANGSKASSWLFGARQAREVGPDHAVEEVLTQRLQRGRQRVHMDRRCPTRRRATLSANRPIASTWSRCEWLMRM